MENSHLSPSTLPPCRTRCCRRPRLPRCCSAHERGEPRWRDDLGLPDVGLQIVICLSPRVRMTRDASSVDRPPALWFYGIYAQLHVHWRTYGPRIRPAYTGHKARIGPIRAYGPIRAPYGPAYGPIRAPRGARICGPYAGRMRGPYVLQCKVQIPMINDGFVCANPSYLGGCANPSYVCDDFRA